MACRIKIKKELEETVDTLSQEGEGKSLPLAKQVANKVNNQFNTKVVDFVISGDYIDKVITIPDPLVDAYYDAQVELEVEEDDLTRRKQGNWTTDKEGNVIPFFESKATTEGKMSVEEVTKFLNPFIKTLTDKFRIPVEIVLSDENFIGRYNPTTKTILINAKKVNTLDDGVFALYHEFLHPAVIAIRNTNPSLAKALYNQAVKKYGPEFVKELKQQYPEYGLQEFQDELLVQVVEKMIKENGIEQLKNSALTSDSLLLNTFNNYWNSIKAFITDVINTVLSKNKLQQITSEDLLNIKSLDSLQNLMLSNKSIDLTTSITDTKSKSIFLEKRTQEDIDKDNLELYNKILAEDNKLKLKEEGKESWYEHPDVNNKLTRITSLVRKVLKQGDIKTDDTTSKNIGTDIHTVIENIIKRKFTNPNEPKSTVLPDSQYKILEQYVNSVLNSYPKGTKFLTEVKVANLKKKYAGTIDLVVINVDGTIDIYDWKSMKISAAARKAGIIPFWKERQYTLQMGFYKEALQQLGNINFGKTRLMPLELVYDNKGNFKTIKTETNSTDEVLQALPLLTERTNVNKEIDDLLDKVVKLYESLSERALSKDSKDIVKKENVYERLRVLRKTIRDLQTKQSFEGFVNAAKLELVTLADIIKNFSDYTDYQLAEALEIADFFTNIDKSLFKTIYDADTSKAQQVKNAVALKDIRESAFQVQQELLNIQKNKIIKASESVGVNNIFSNFIGIGGFSKWFKGINQINIPIIKTFWKLVEKQKLKITRDLKSIIAELEIKNTNLENWAKSKGMSLQQAFDLIINKDTGNLLDKYQKSFYKDKNEALNKKDVKWLKDNTTFDKVKVKEFIDKTVKSINEQKYHYKPDINSAIKAQRLNDFLKNYDLNNNYNTAILNKKNGFVKPSDKFLTQEWRQLNSADYAPLLDYYKFFTGKLDEFKDFLPVDYKGNFIPNIQKDFIERATTNGIGAFSDMDWIKDNFRVTANDQFGEIDELTGEPKRTVPIYFIKDIDVSKKSFDLSKSLATFAKVAYTYKYMEEIEGTARLLRNQLTESKEIETNIFGEVTYKDNKEIQLRNVSSETVEAFDTFINYYIYGVTNTTKDRATKFGDDTYSFNKGVQNVLAFNSKRALAFNTLSATANLIGGLGNLFSIAARQKWFNRSNFLSSLKTLSAGPNVNEVPYLALEYFDILGEQDILNKMNTLSSSEIIKKYNSDKWFILQRGGDWVVQNTIVLSMLKSHTLNNGKVVPLSQVKDAKSLFDMLEVKNDKLNLQELLSDEEYLKLRNKMQRIAEMALGMSSRDNINTAKLSLGGRVIMQFRNWIPRMAEVRFGQLAYDEDLETYMKGKYASFFWDTLATKKALPLVKELVLGFGENTKERARELWIQAKIDNPTLEITEEEYYNMHVENLRATMQELIIILSAIASYMAIKPDPDDDEAGKLRKHIAKTLARSVDELAFFISIPSLNEILGKAVPLQSLFTNIFNFISHTTKEIYGQITQDEEITKKAKPQKYIARIFPIANEVEKWFPGMDFEEESK